VQDGNVASYIPELSRANPNWFDICLATTEGQVYEVSDTRQPFTIRSISKSFVYGLVLEDHGKDAVLQKIGVEPSGDAFNSISLYPDSGRPFNPMINAGAVATTGLVRGVDTADRLRRILRMFGRYSGQAKTVDHLVYQSEKSTGHRNRAIGHMLRWSMLTPLCEPNY
jgi:glutaminase